MEEEDKDTRKVVDSDSCWCLDSPEQVRTVKAGHMLEDEVVDAVHQVANMVPGWEVPRELVALFYITRNIKTRGDDLKTQIEALGECVKSRFYDRCYGMWDGHRLDEKVFRENWADAFIREISWYESFRAGRLTRFPPSWAR